MHPLHQRMISYLNGKEPITIRQSMDMFDAMKTVLTWREIRNIMDNGLGTSTAEEFRQIISKTVTQKIGKTWAEVVQYSLSQGKAYRTELYEWRKAIDWITNHGAKLAVQLTGDQIGAIRTIIGMSFGPEAQLSPDVVSRLLRPIVGLTERQATSVFNYQKKLVKNGYSEGSATKAAERYAQTKQRERALTIARTELSNAYNYGAHSGTENAIELGIMKQVSKIWDTADDERVCELCGPMDGVRVPFKNPFIVNGDYIDYPPLHPNCRCLVMYLEPGDPYYA